MSDRGEHGWERSLLESVNDVIYSVDGDLFAGKVTFVNSQAERILGYPAEAFAADATLWIRNVHPDDLPRLLESTHGMIATRMPITRLFRVRHSDGKRFVWFEDRVVPKLAPDGSVNGILGVARDVTARREAEIELDRSLRRLQRLEGVGRFSAGIAHDLNNLFTVLSGSADMLARSYNDQALAALREATERGLDLTRHLLAFLRGNAAPILTLDLNTVVTEMAVLLVRLVGADVEIVTELESNLAPVRGNPSLIAQVLLNLAGNAREAMTSGGRLTIATATLPDGDGPWALLRVADTGSGMDEETKRRAFEPLFTTKEDGTGLGLATVQQIVAELGGRIHVESAPTRGTMFEIRLPFGGP